MREIKFRAFDYTTKRIYPVLSVGDRSDCSAMAFGLHAAILYSYNCPSGLLKVGKDIELMQFTGLLDRSGKEVYEGDIIAIQHKHPNWHGKESRWSVVLGETTWGYAFDWEHISGYDCSTHVIEDNPISFEVIGNIYENPELLEAK